MKKLIIQCKLPHLTITEIQQKNKEKKNRKKQKKRDNVKKPKQNDKDETPDLVDADSQDSEPDANQTKPMSDLAFIMQLEK